MHPLNVFRLLAGLLFVGLGLVFLADAASWFELEVRYVWPALLLGLGAAGLLSSVRRA